MRISKIIKNYIALIAIMTINCYINSLYAATIDLSQKSIIKNYGGSDEDETNKAVQLSDGGFIVLGRSCSKDMGYLNKGSYDAIMMKYDKNGVLEKTTTFGGNDWDYFEDAAETSDGGIICVGYTYSTNLGIGLKGRSDCLVVKYDKDGNQEWVKTFGGNQQDFFASVVASPDGGVVAVGKSKSTNAGFTNNGDFDTLAIKYSSDGTVEWTKTSGAATNDGLCSVIQTSDNGFIVGGYIGSDYALIKYSSNGTEEWNKTFGGSGGDSISSMIALDDGFIVCGESNSDDWEFNNIGLSDVFVSKHNYNGELQWARNYGGSGGDYNYNTIKLSNDNLLLIGETYSRDLGYNYRGNGDGLAIEIDSDGNLVNILVIGGDDYDYLSSAIETDDGILFIGSSYSTDSHFDNIQWCDFFIAKYTNECIEKEHIFDMIYDITTLEELEDAREIVNSIKDNELKDFLNDKLNTTTIDFGSLEKKTSSSNLDIYIKSQNTLSLSLDTNSVTFEGYSAVEEMEKKGAVNITIDSSLPYSLNAYMPTEISNSDGSKKMNMNLFYIKESTETDYGQFINTTDKIVLKDICIAGNNKVHSIDLKLNSNEAHEADIYKTAIKFEAEQK